MKILTRYILREHIGPLIFALSALTALLLLNQVAKQFGSLVGKGLSWGVIGEFFFLSIPFIVAMTLPMAVLVAVLYAFSRLTAENEVTAMRANGVSMVRAVAPVMAGGAVLALVMLVFNDQVLPRANHRLRTLQTDIARKKPTFALREQVINEVIPGKLFLKTGHIDEATNRMREVSIYNFDDPSRRKTIWADSGHMGLTPDQQDLQMTLHDGYMQQISRDNLGELSRLYYKTDLVRVRGVGNSFEQTEKDNYKSEREMSVCEMNEQYQRGRNDLLTARQDLATILGNAARYAATGDAPSNQGLLSRQDTTRKFPDQVTSGSLYCRLVTPLFGSMSGDDTSTAPKPATPAAPAMPANPTPTPAPATVAAAQPPVQAPPMREPPMREPPMRAPSSAATMAKERLAAVAKGKTAIIPPGHLGGGSTRPPSSPSAGAVVAASAARYNPYSMGSAAQLEVMRARITDARTTMSRYEVEIQKKFALAAACVVFVLLGAPVGMRFPRGGVGLVIGVSIVAFAIYYVGLIAGESLADKLILSPFWAMWMANVLFAAIGAVLLVRVQRSGGTTRGGDLGELLDNARSWLARRRGRGVRVRTPRGEAPGTAERERRATA